MSDWLEELEEYQEKKEQEDLDEQYDRWREDCVEEFDDELLDLVWKYVNKKNHYMNTFAHLIQGLKNKADYLEKYQKEFEESRKNKEVKVNEKNNL